MIFSYLVASHYLKLYYTDPTTEFTSVYYGNVSGAILTAVHPTSAENGIEQAQQSGHISLENYFICNQHVCQIPT